MRKELYEAIIKGNVLKFYKSKEWKQKRAEALKRDHNECQKHKARGKFAVANHVHHIKELKDFPKLGLNLHNLISLCKSCHNEEHPERLGKVDKKHITEERW